MDNNQKAIELMEKVRMTITTMADALWVEGRKQDSCILHEQRQRISKVEALLKPCETDEMCKGCEHLTINRPHDGYCYMFKDKPKLRRINTADCADKQEKFSK